MTEAQPIQREDNDLRVTHVQCGLTSQDHYVVEDRNANFFAKTYSSLDARLIAGAPALLRVAKKMLAEIDFEVGQRQHGGNDEDSCDLKRLSDAAHAVIREATGGTV